MPAQITTQPSTQTTSQPSTRAPFVCLLLSALSWGTIGVATASLYRVAETDALSIGFLRMAIASPVLLLSCWYVLRREMFRITPRDFAIMMLLGFGMALYQFFYFAAIARVGVIIASLVTLCLAPVIIMLLSALLLREAPTRRLLVALALALLGTTLLVGFSNSENSLPQATNLEGIWLALGAAFGYATVTLSGRVVAPRYHPLQPIAIGFTGSTIMMLPFILTSGLVLTYPLSGWLWISYMALIPTTLAYILYIYALRSITANVASIFTLLEPLTASILAWLLFGEALSGLGLLGGLLLLGAMGLLVRGEGRGDR